MQFLNQSLGFFNKGCFEPIVQKLHYRKLSSTKAN